MKKYVKPEVVETKDYAEGVYLASGGSTDNSSGPEETACRSCSCLASASC